LGDLGVLSLFTLSHLIKTLPKKLIVESIAWKNLGLGVSYTPRQSTFGGFLPPIAKIIHIQYYPNSIFAKIVQKHQEY